MPKKITAELINKWHNTVSEARPAFGMCADLRDDFGPCLPFFIKPDVYNNFPFSKLGIPKINISNLVPKIGESWVLFCYSQVVENEHTPLRTDGFMLPFEWRKNTGHSKLMPAAMRELAERVIASLNPEEKWGLYPTHERFGDKFDFSDEQLFGKNVGSAWAALAIGLESAIDRYAPLNWPFCSLQMNEKTGLPTNVEGIEQKISVAASYNCYEFVVAPSQEAEAKKALERLQSRELAGSKSIQIVAADPKKENLINSILYSHIEWLKPSKSVVANNQEYIGRQWLIDEVLETSSETQLTLVSGSPGSGKSALMQKIVELQGDNILANYSCSYRPALDYVKTIAYQVAIEFSEEFRASGTKKIRELSQKTMEWENLKEFYITAVVNPLHNHKPKSEKKLTILVDALDETHDRDIVKLLSEPDLQLPDWIRVIITSRPMQEIQQILGRTVHKIIDLDSGENASQCRTDLDEYIKQKLVTSGLLKNDLLSGDIELNPVFKAIQQRAVSYRYAQFAFINIGNGTYSIEQLEKQLPEGIQGHYLAFFDSNLKGLFNEVKPLLEILAASPVALSKPFTQAVLKLDCGKIINKLRGYVTEEENLLTLCDYTFREWLITKKINADFSVDLVKSHQKLAEYGWEVFGEIVSLYGDKELTVRDYEQIKSLLPFELQNTLGEHIVNSGITNMFKSKKYVSDLLVIECNPEYRAKIAKLAAVRESSSSSQTLEWNKVIRYSLIFILLPSVSLTFVYKYLQLSNPFDISVIIKEERINPNLPFKIGNLVLTYGEKKEEMPIINNQATFKEIPSSFRDTEASLMFKADGYENIDTAIVLEDGNHIEVRIKRDNSFSRIFGFVKNEEGKPISDVKITVQNINVISKEDGSFELEIPLEKQKKQQHLTAYKSGYKIHEDDDIYPSNKQSVSVILKVK